VTRFKANDEGNSDPAEAGSRRHPKGSEALQVAMQYFCVRLRLSFLV
jgi:hypothetical protein